MKKIFLSLLLSLFLLPNVIWAHSYIYIQGDKETPIYIKVDGKMVPRLGMHYCIIPQLDEGELNIEVLFQENKYPKQQFKVMVPKDAYRGFMLTKTSDQSFALYDMISKGYINNGNEKDEAFVNINKPKEDSYIAASNNANNRNELPAFQAEESKKSSNKDDKFLDVDLNQPQKYKTKAEERAERKKQRQEERAAENLKNDETNYTNSESQNNTNNDIAAVIPNSDCPNAMSNEQFENYSYALMDVKDEERQLRYIRNSYERHCFSTQQAGILANMVSSSSTKFEILKLIYPRVVDQGNYSNLENIFQSNYLKKQFRDMLKGD